MNRCRFFLTSNFLLYRSAWRGSPAQFNSIEPFLLNVPSFREKGHSKWQNIRHIKEAKDREKSHRFNKILLEMKRAIAEGGSNNPEANAALANIISSAKRASMPAATIQNALKGSKEKPLHSVWFEIKGPKGTLLYVSTMASQPSLIKQTIRQIIRRMRCPGFEFVEKMAKGVFDHKGIILAEPPPDSKNIEESSLEDAIETGAEEVTPLEDSNLLEFVTPANSLHKVRHALEAKNYVIQEAEATFIPRVWIELEDEEAAVLQALYDELDKIPEVVHVHTNF